MWLVRQSELTHLPLAFLQNAPVDSAFVVFGRPRT